MADRPRTPLAIVCYAKEGPSGNSTLAAVSARGYSRRRPAPGGGPRYRVTVGSTAGTRVGLTQRVTCPAIQVTTHLISHLIA